jgi:virginiamycin A acetyltransferase
MITYGKCTYADIQIIGNPQSTVNVGKFCSVADQVKAFMWGDHNFDLISTFPFPHHKFGYKGKIGPKHPETQRYNKRHRYEINIGNDVWIGYGVILFRDVTIGDGCVLGAFSKITKDIPPYSIVVGDSRITRKRFLDEDIHFLLKLRWWDLTDEFLKDVIPLLHTSNIKLLKDWYEKNKDILQYE